MDLLDLCAGLTIAVGLVGIVVPVLPGSLLVAGAVLVWAVLEGSVAAYATFAVAATLLAAGTVLRYLVPGRRLQAGGIPGRTLVVGGLAGLVGFFVVPLLGLPLGFVGGVYLAERRRIGRELAVPSTRQAVLAAGLSLLIELTAGLLTAATWLTGAVVV